MSKASFDSLFPNKQLQPQSTRLRTYTGEEIPVLGSMNVDVKYGKQSARLPLSVVDTGGPNLIGRNWLQKFKLNWNEVYLTTTDSLNSCDTLIGKYPELFKEGLGTNKGVKGKIYMKENASPKFYKPRQVPYALKAKVDTELMRLQNEGIIEPVQFADWATPIVPVLKI